MTRGNRAIAQRRRFFVGCEGESEQSYIALLARLVEEANLAVHLDAVLLQPGGGDPLAIMQRAAKRATERDARRGDRSERRFVLLDRDKIGIAPERDGRIARVAAEAGLEPIWQDPCHEALLLRHLDGCARLRPLTTVVAARELSGRWPTYRKALPASKLAERLDRQSLTRVATVEPDLASLFAAIGFQTGEPSP